jgi:hypothetical protein
MNVIRLQVIIKLSDHVWCVGKEGAKYTKYCVWCHQFYLSFSILIVNRMCIITSTNRKPNIIWHSLLNKCGCLKIYNVEIIVTSYVICSSKLQSSMTIFHYKMLNVKYTNE